MKTDQKTFAIRDVSRALIAFGIIILVLNFNQYLIIYLFGIITLVIGFLNLFSLNLRIKFAGALNMALVGIYFIIFSLVLYPGIFGLVGNLIILAMGLILLMFSLRFLIYYLRQKEQITF